MKIEHLELSNFRTFKKLAIDFDSKSTIIAGENGSGKSTILSALAFLAYTWINRLNKSQGKEFESLQPQDIFNSNEEAILTCAIQLEGETFSLEKNLRRPRNNERSSSSKSSSSDYKRLVRDFKSMYLNAENNGTMPIFVFYGTNRAVNSKTTSQRELDNAFGDKLTALERALDSKATFAQFFSWFVSQETETAINRIDNPNYVNRSLDLVRKVTEDVLGNVKNLRAKNNPRRLSVEKDGREIRVDHLSDGEKCMLALFGDLVRRLALANPSLSNPLEGEGVVLIDEIELHLHPTWQRLILRKLTDLFPNIQFIVSTHSPQVLSEADDSFNVFFLSADGGIKKSVRLDGYDANIILDDFMHAESKNPATSQLVNYAYTAIDQGNYNKAENLISQVKKLCGSDGEDYILLSGYLKRSMRR